MSASPRTPTARKSLARVPSMGGHSITSCFGASVPVSPRRTGGHGLLGGQAFGNYKQLNGCDEDEDEDEGGAYTYIPSAQAERLNVSHRRQRSFSHLAGRQRPMREKGNKRDMHYTSEGEGRYSGERTASMKLGSHWILKEKPRISFCSTGAEAPQEELYESEQGFDEYSRERRGVRKLGKLWSTSWETGNVSSPTKTVGKEMYHGWSDQGDADVNVRERNGGRKLGKQLWRMSEKARSGAYYAVKPQREEHDPAADKDHEGGTRERKSTSRVSMQLGKQVSMREKEGLEALGSPRRETLCRKVREACMQVLESARRSSPHVSELFVGNQLLMHVTSSSSSALSARRGRNVAPSAGFLATGEANLCASMSGSPAYTSTS